MAIVPPGRSVWNQRMSLAARAERLRALIQAVGRPNDLSPAQWVQILAFTQEFAPDLIIELGRGFGNSTCCFLEAVSTLRTTKPCRVLSLCLTDEWEARTRFRLEPLCPLGWFEPAIILQQDILAYDFQSAVANAERCLVFWDAHGFDIAECVLGGLLPFIAERPHVVLMHDMVDNRYFSKPKIRSYESCGMWKGDNAGTTGFWVGHVFSRVAQAISAVDFTNRNNMPLHSADETLHEFLGADPARLDEMRQLLGDDLFSLRAGWFWFSVNEAPGPVFYPPFSRKMPPPPPGDGTPPAEVPVSPLSHARMIRRRIARLARRIGLLPTPSVQ